MNIIGLVAAYQSLEANYKVYRKIIDQFYEIKINTYGELVWALPPGGLVPITKDLLFYEEEIT